jgi:hypothetical protein
MTIGRVSRISRRSVFADFLSYVRMLLEVLLVVERMHPDGTRRSRLCVDVERMVGVGICLGYPAIWKGTWVLRHDGVGDYDSEMLYESQAG